MRLLRPALWFRAALVTTGLVAHLLAGPVAIARVIGKTEAGPPLTAARIRSTLPAAQQAPWLDYLQRSQEQMRQDQAALAHERMGVAALPPLPPSDTGARSMPLSRDDVWYASAEARHIADVIVSFQTPAGGWGKNMNMAASPRTRGQSFVSNNENRFSAPGDLDQPQDASWHYVGTLDNDATTTEIQFLVRVAAQAPSAAATVLRNSALRGIVYLLQAQYPNGGWPQVWPLEGGYHDAITFNDDAIRNAVEVLQAAARGATDWSFVPADLRTKARLAAERGIRCVLASQAVSGGRRAVWGQQHDPLTLQPVAARNFEPAAFASQESAALLVLLQAQPVKTEQLREAEQQGEAWLCAHALYGVAVVGSRQTPEGRHVVQQPGAGPLWARFYDLQTGLPIFGDRDRTIHDAMNELSPERRNGYAWYTAAPASLLRADICKQ